MNVDLFETPLSKTKVRNGVYAYKYRNGCININGEKFSLIPLKMLLKFGEVKIKNIEVMIVKEILQENDGKRFSVNKAIIQDFALYAIIDNEYNKVVCHMVYDNGEEYCEEMVNKMLAGLNGQL